MVAAVVHGRPIAFRAATNIEGIEKRLDRLTSGHKVQRLCSSISLAQVDSSMTD